MNINYLILIIALLVEIICDLFCIFHHIRTKKTGKKTFYSDSPEWGWIVMMICGLVFSIIGIAMAIEHPYSSVHIIGFSCFIIGTAIATIHEYGGFQFSFDFSNDLFRGNLKNPEVFIILGVFFSCCVFYLAAENIYDAYNYLDHTNTEYFEGEFVSYEVKGSQIQLTLKNEKTEFVIHSYPEYGSNWHQDFLEEIGQKKTFRIHAEYMDGGRSSPSKYIIYQLTSESDNTYITFERANALDNQNALNALPVTGGILLIWLIICIVFVLVTRNLHKFRNRN